MGYCTECGTKLEEGMRFCPKCGPQLAMAKLAGRSEVGAVSGVLAPEEQDAVEQVTQYIGNSLTARKDKWVITKELMKQGWREKTAYQFVRSVEAELKRGFEEYVKTPSGREAMASVGKRRMLHGTLWAVGGAAIGVGSYYADAYEGGVVILAWGAIIFGVYGFVRGLVEWLNYRT